MAKVVVVKFKNNCKPYYFSAGKFSLERGQGVVVETARGTEYGIVVDPEKEIAEKDVVSPLKPVLRPASAHDKETVKRNEERRGEAMRICKEKIRKHNLQMKLIDCEFALDGSKVVFTVIEWVRGKPISRKVEAIIHAVGFVLLLGFAVLVDILQFVI